MRYVFAIDPGSVGHVIRERANTITVFSDRRNSPDALGDLEHRKRALLAMKLPATSLDSNWRKAGAHPFVCSAFLLRLSQADLCRRSDRNPEVLALRTRCSLSLAALAHEQ
jgi:hypothetical protein